MAALVFLCFLFFVRNAVFCLNCTENSDGSIWSVTSDGNVTVYGVSEKVQIVNETLPVVNLIEINCALVELVLDSCGIKEIQPGAFIVNGTDIVLLEIAITRNAIEGIKEGVFNDVPVRILKLPNNKISTIASGAFNNNSYLETIDLSSNELTYLDPLWFTGCEKLSVFNINRNKIQQINVASFQSVGANASVSINLSINILRSFDPLLLENYNDVESLNISNNLLIELKEELFENRTVRYLDLENNNLTCLPDSVFNAKVEVLNIMKNLYMRCDCLRKLKEWTDNSEVIIFYPSIICEDRENEIMVVYNTNTTSVIPIPKPEFFGIPKGS